MPITNPAAHLCGVLAAGPAGLKARATRLGRRGTQLSAGVGDAAPYTDPTAIGSTLRAGQHRHGLILVTVLVAGLTLAGSSEAQSRRIEPA
jgi:hypothetical protein